MPEISYLNQRDTISAAINELNKYPVNYKRPSINSLMLENKMLKNEVELLKIQFTATQEELETYKYPGTSSLHSVLKYNFSHALQVETLDSSES
ncbi:5052_t:CDS:2, partial [Scutellospora calospora]